MAYRYECLDVDCGAVIFAADPDALDTSSEVPNTEAKASQEEEANG